MKKFTSIAIAFLLMLSVIPAMAGDQTGSAPVMSQAVDKAPPSFQALSKLSVTQRQALTPLTETELASIEGSLRINAACNIAVCGNFIFSSQSNSNTSAVSAVSQTNNLTATQNFTITQSN